MAKNATAEVVDDEQAEHDELDATETVEEAKAKGPRERYVDFATWLENEQGQTGLDPMVLQIAVTQYNKFAQSDFNKEKTAARRAAAKAEKEEKSAAYRDRRQAAAIRNQEKTRTALEKAAARLQKAQEQAERQAQIAAGEVPARKPRKSKVEKAAEQEQDGPAAVAEASGATAEVTFASEGSARVTEAQTEDEF